MADWFKHVLLTPLLIAAAMLLSGCSGLFFYPDKAVYVTPDRLNLDYADVYLNTPDGERLHGWWLPAKGDPQGTIYFLHGNAQNISSHIFNVAWLPKADYNVFLIDYRGFGQSTGEPDIPGALQDSETGLRWLARKHTADKLYILGQSLGGGFATVLASEWTQRHEKPMLKGVILDSTLAGFRSIAREKLASVWLTWPFQIPLSWTIPDDYEGVDYIGKISPVPVMVIHSTRDGIIPYHNAIELYDAAKEPKRFLKTDTPHAGTFVIPAYREAVLDFLNQRRARPH